MCIQIIMIMTMMSIIVRSSTIIIISRVRPLIIFNLSLPLSIYMHIAYCLLPTTYYLLFGGVKSLAGLEEPGAGLG